MTKGIKRVLYHYMPDLSLLNVVVKVGIFEAKLTSSRKYIRIDYMIA